NTVNVTTASPSRGSSPTRPQSEYTPIGVTTSSVAITPESRAIARSGRFCLASARTSAVHVTSYAAPISARYGGGASGDTCGRAHPTTDNVNPMITSLPRVVVDATVSSDEPLDTSLVHLVQRLQPRPRGERDPLRHRRIRREDNLARVLPHDRAQLVDDLGARAVVLDHDSACLEVVD